MPAPEPKRVDAAPRKPVLSIADLRVEVVPAGGHRPLVDAVSFEVGAGETVCLVGESGSGKSVTSLAVMGLLPKGILRATRGSITIDGEDVLAAGEPRLRRMRASTMAMVFQEPMTALNPVQRVGRQIEEVLRAHTSLSARERRGRVMEMLEAVHLPEVARIRDAFPHQLSGGQRQRIVIAMALILKPRVLIADEPTTALDVTTQRQILLLIRELQRVQQTAVVFVTHDFGVVSEIADRIVVMHRGSVVEAGRRETILAGPKQDYTRMLVSSVPSLIPRRRGDPEAETVLDVIDLGKQYGEQQFLRITPAIVAARNVSLTVARGEITGIVGESGSGKSTVARCIERLVEPSSGSVLLRGDDLAKLRPRELRLARRRVQFVFQDPYRSLNPRRRVGESVIEGLVNYGIPRWDALTRAAQALELVGLDGAVMDRYPHQFSGGQRQRICIARALVMEPDLLIADEAVSALDVSVQAQVLDLIDTVRARTGVAILFITHDLRVAAQICNTIVVMRKGEVVESGDAIAVLGSPQHDYTRALIAAAPGRDWDFQRFRPASPASDDAVRQPPVQHDEIADPLALLGGLASTFARTGTDEALEIARTRYGLGCEATRFATEKDDTFKISSSDGRHFILKLANPAEDAAEIDLQVQVLGHLAAVAPTLPVPRVVADLCGERQLPYRDRAGQHRQVWMLSYIEGQPLSEVRSTPAGRREIGKVLARLRLAMAEFSHPADTRAVAWDMTNLMSLRGLVGQIDDAKRRRQVEIGLARFAEIEPRLARSRAQVLHNDFNKANILVDPSSPTFVSGVIDFGDTVRTAIAIDVATAMMNQLSSEPDGGDMLADGRDVLTGYLTVADLTDDELELIPHLIMARVVTRALLSTALAKLVPERAAYILRNTERGWHQLDWLLNHPAAAKPGEPLRAVPLAFNIEEKP